MADQFNYPQYLIRRKIFTLVGAKFHVYNSNNEVVLFSKLKAFKLKEDIRLFTGEDMTTELVGIRARNVIDFSGFYDVFDSQTGVKIGALRRKGMKSIVRDEWLILDAYDNEIGMISEDSLGLALVRRLLFNLIPQSYNVVAYGKPVATFKQNFNPFVVKLNLDFSLDQEGALDKRLGIAAGILLCAIDAKQQ